MAFVRKAALAVLGSILAGNGMSMGRPSPGDVDEAFRPVIDPFVVTATVQADHGILVALRTGGTGRNHLVRLLPNGDPDPGFEADVRGDVSSIIVLGDGGIVLGGAFRSIGGVERVFAARLHPDGALDAGFDPRVSGEGSFTGVYTTLLLPDGRFILGGIFDTVGGIERAHLARIESDGSVDPAFDPRVSADGGFASVNALVRQSDGRILVGGGFTGIDGVARTNLARLHPDGSLDPDFNPGVSGGEFGGVYAIREQPDGMILVGGIFHSVAGTARTHMARLHPDGSLDMGFDPQISGAGTVGVFTMGLQTDARLVIGGFFKAVGGIARNAMARLLPDGTIDAAFAASAYAEVAAPVVSGVLIQGDGSVVIGGRFAGVNGQPRANLALLKNDAATQNLAVTAADRIEWLRGGASPEAEGVAFDLSTDGGMIWSALGAGVRIPGGWQLTDLALPVTGSVRARARVTDGAVTSGLVETLADYALMSPPPEFTAVTLSGDGSLRMEFTAPAGETFTVLATDLLGLPRSQWMPMGPARELVPGEYEFVGSATPGLPFRFYVVRSEPRLRLRTPASRLHLPAKPATGN